MSRTVVAAVTDRVAAEPALALAIALARPLGANVILAGVVERHGHEPPTGDSRLNRLVDALDTLAEAAPGDVPVETDGRAASSTVRGLQQLASAHDAELLVLGPDDRGAVRRALFGDTEANAIFTASCGIAFALPEPIAAAPRRLGVAWDGSPESGEALEWAVQLAERTGGTVEIVHVARDGVEAAARREGELERLRAAAEPRVPATVTLAWGERAELLEHVSARLDLLVMGSRAEGPLRRVLHSSVSRAVVHGAHCPVLVLPRGVHAPADAAAR